MWSEAAAVSLPPGGESLPEDDTGRGGKAKKCSKTLGLIAMTSHLDRAIHDASRSPRLPTICLLGFMSLATQNTLTDTDPQYRPSFWSLELDWFLTPIILTPTYAQFLSHSLLPHTHQESTQHAFGVRWWVSCTVYTRCRGPAYLMSWCQLRPRN